MSASISASSSSFSAGRCCGGVEQGLRASFLVGSVKDRFCALEGVPEFLDAVAANLRVAVQVALDGKLDQLVKARVARWGQLVSEQFADGRGADADDPAPRVEFVGQAVACEQAVDRFAHLGAARIPGRSAGDRV